MPSWGGFDTWLEYEFLILKVVVVGAVLFWVGRTLLDYVALAPIPMVELALYASGLAVLLSLGLAWWFGRDRR